MLMLLMNLGFPFTLNFFGELVSLIGIISIDYYLIVLFLLSSFINCLFWFYLFNRKVPLLSSGLVINLGFIEIGFISYLLFAGLVGFWLVDKLIRV